MTPAERVKASNIEVLKKAVATPRVRRLISESKKGDKNPMKRPEIAEKVSKTIKEKWGPFFSEQLKTAWREGRMKPRWAQGATTQSPNKKEQLLAEILVTAAPAFQFVGNGAFWIGPCLSGKRRNPDFINKKEKKVILLHGEYWHTPEQAEVQTIDYQKKGWDVLTIWVKELRMKERAELLGKLATFSSGASFQNAS